MGRLIDADKLMEELTSFSMHITGSHHQDFIVSQCKNSIKRMVDEQPAVDVPDINVGEWIPCNERLPENAKHKGAFCPKYWVMTKYGQTIGWYNPDFESWFVLVWFITSRCLESEIDLDRADIPKVVKVPIKTEIVKAWMPLPEPYRPDLGDEE